MIMLEFHYDYIQHVSTVNCVFARVAWTTASYEPQMMDKIGSLLCTQE